MKKSFYRQIIISFIALSCIMLLSAGITAGKDNKKLSAPATADLSASSSPTPPKAEIKPYKMEKHGDIRIDDYYWLRNRDNSKVMDYLKAENAYTDAMLSDTEDLQKALYDEMLARIKETDLSVPEKIGNYYYYSRTEQGKQYRIHCRKKESLEAEEEVLLDENALAENENYFQLGAYEISPDHNLLAYSTDLSGAERFTVKVKNLLTGKLLADEIASTTQGLVWANDNKTLFYRMTDEADRPYRIYTHVLGAPNETDKLRYEEKDVKFIAGSGKTRDHKWIVILSVSSTSSEYYLLDADNPTEPLKLFMKRQPLVEYGIDHHEGNFYILTNENAVNFKLMVTSAENIEPSGWKEFVAHRDDVKIDDIDIFENYMVIYERYKGQQTMRYYDFRKKNFTEVDFPEPVYSYWSASNEEYKTDKVRFTYNSLTTPRSVFDLDMSTGKRELMKMYEVLGGYNPEEYQSERIFAKASDETSIPVSLVYKKGFKRDGSAPMYLTGYGAYGSSYDPYFSSNRISLLDRGFIYGIAHIRGGEELGRPWYIAGKLLNKMNSFTDFIACAKHLEDMKYTSPDRLVIQGGSGGGLLIGSVLNMAPELFAAAVADVPFVDAVTTMLDPTIPLTTGEYEEWGNPEEKEYYDYIKSYSPYDNVAKRDYPHILVTAGLNDSRVQYWEPAKWVAKLRALKTDDNLLVLKTNLDAGHGGASGRYDFLKEIALEYAFILKVLKIQNK